MSFAANDVVGRLWMPLDEFRAFQAVRPDHERWELVDGVPVLMTPTQLGHARIASNVERLLSDALEAHDPTRTALQNIGVDLGLAAETLAGLGRASGYAPQPDVGVIDAEFDPEQRFAERLYVAVEVVSSTDDEWLASAGMLWIEAKTRIYQAHPHCEAVIVVEQHRMQVRFSHRTDTGWQTRTFTATEDDLVVPMCGLKCKIGDLYRGTPLAHALSSHRTI